jgi:hypothetical protein
VRGRGGERRGEEKEEGGKEGGREEKRKEERAENNKYYQGCEESGTLCTVGRNVKWCSCCGSSMKFPQRITNVTITRANNSSAGNSTKRIEIRI